MSALTTKARQYLRGLGHHKRPVVLVGKDGVTDGLIEATAQALFDHELIKIKLGENADGDRHALTEQLAAGAKADVVGVIGRTALLYKRHPNKPKILVPQEKKKKQSGSTAK